LRWILERCHGIDCTYLAQDRDQLRGVVNTVTNFLVLENVGKIFYYMGHWRLLKKGSNISSLTKKTAKQTPWPESASEPYRPSDRHLSAKLVATCVDRVVTRSQLDGSPTAVISFSRPDPLLFLPSSSSIVLRKLSGPRSRPTTSLKIW
jgi:hypothetical protein